MNEREWHEEFSAGNFKQLGDNSGESGLFVDLIVKMNKNSYTYRITQEVAGAAFTIVRIWIGSISITLDAGIWSFIAQCLKDQAMDLMDIEGDSDLIDRTIEAAEAILSQLEGKNTQ